MVPMAEQRIAKSVKAFVTLPLQVPPQQSFQKETTHYLYICQNAPKVPTQDTPRELFLVNIPIDTTESHIKSIFANRLGGARVESVAFEGARTGKGITAPVAPVQKQQGRKRKRAQTGEGEGEGTVADEEVGLLPETWDRELHGSGSTAIATFVDRANAELAMKETRKAAKGDRAVRWPSEADLKTTAPPSLGIPRYLAHHRLRHPSHAELQQSVDGYMAAFAAQEAHRAQLLARQRQEPDADGFITVTRGGRNGPAREEETRAREEELKRRERNRVKDDFYRFQTRERKKEEAKDLVREFEEDRRKVEELRRRRGKVRPE
ncbi:hypothetical protein K431DRAFT_226502 [Polychaeton citri CBS 116435]|uniref:RRM domain-containing protein n=1 Tax=Polychaeton citri CBS 116435 TaxID=1314669 RepID=A0A9P4Q4K1_9PEZI|nr:hypothetical protein K431DRAFT_226502 [Polychaeton citri CBS 116435]